MRLSGLPEAKKGRRIAPAAFLLLDTQGSAPGLGLNQAVS